MRYVSTRGAAHDAPRRFSEILLAGLADDGGLYMPIEYPNVTREQLAQWRRLPYADLAFEILSRFADDIAPETLRALCRATYTAERYKHVRDGENAADIAPLRKLGEEQGAPLCLLGLSNGPTLAFKDMAMQLLGALFEHALASDEQELNILGATSGDTGSAAEHAMRGRRGISVFMLSPHGRMSAFQRAQMFSLQDANIHNLAVQGVFDDCQDIVKAVSEDAAFKTRWKIGTVNSINWARVVAQVVYYFKAWFAATSSDDEVVSFSVPSGNFGNVCAGHIARMMGLPIRRLICATNENDVLDEFFRTGTYRPRNAAQTHATSSPSMDISKASNFERFVADVVHRDAGRVAQLWRDVARGQGFTLDADTMRRVTRVDAGGYGFASTRSTHADRLDAMRVIASRYKIAIDPHTADGIVAARRALEPGVPMIVLETAQPAKFNETAIEAFGHDAPRPSDFIGIESLPQRFEVVAADAQQVKTYIAAHAASE